MVVPDGSVLARALTSSTAKFVGENPDVQFRTQLLRSSLRIDSQPSLEDVVKYQQHLQAEVESLMAARATHSIPPPAIKSVEATNPSSPNSSSTSKPQCKYFIKTSGCRRVTV